ncbi:ATP-binding cassette domain-containing protein [Dactylosporangium sp. NPDC050688]|uniref:ATP-binding cassette domain-containing protein n=1 Tax=Dactylosporangium sp. NPDC050688 TaxID=3157217 RepID=UPI0033C914B4
MTSSLQLEDNDCGVQALITSLTLLGYDFSVPALREALAVRGARSMRDLRDTSAEVCGAGYEGRRDCPFAALTTGAIVHLRANHFVTVERRRRHRVRIFDPAFGFTWLDEHGYRERASGWVLLPVDPAPEGAAPPAGRGGGRNRAVSARRARRAARASWLWPMLRSGQVSPRQLVPLVAVSLVLYTGLTLLNIVLMPYLDRVTTGTVGAGALVAVLAAFCAVLSGLYWFQHRQFTALGLQFDRAMLAHLTGRMTRTSATTEMTSGGLLHRVQSAREVRAAGTELALSVITDAVAVLILLGFMASLSLPLAGVVVALAAVQVVLSLLARRPINRTFEEQLRLDAEAQEVLITMSRGLTTFRGIGAVSHLRAEHGRRFDLLIESVRSLEYRLARVHGPTNALRVAGLYVVLVLGAMLLSAGLVSTGELFGFLTLGGAVLFAATSIAQNLPTVATLERQLRYVATLFTMPVMAAGTRGEPVPSAPAVVLDQVRVHRPAQRFDLRLDLLVERGETVTVGGVSGIGKSTMAQIISGLDPAPSGTAFVFGIPVGAWDPDRLRPRVCYVPPRSDFLHSTIRDSLASGLRGLEDRELLDMLALMELGDVVGPLRLGLDTSLRINGATFSAGEVQRFALARALLRRPELLVLDEATNSMDRDMELRLLSVIQRRVETLIVISHRPVGEHLGSRQLSIVRDGDGVSRVVAGVRAAVTGA